MSVHKKRADLRAKHKDPINFTCGVCGQVHKFDKENPYICPNKKDEEEGEDGGSDD